MRRGTQTGWTLFVVCLALGVALTANSALAQPAGGAAPAAPESENYFTHFVINGGPIVWFILIPLSIVIVALAIMYGLEIRRKNLVPIEELARIRSLLEARQYREAVDETANSPSMLGFVVNKALGAAGMGYASMQRAMEDAVDQRSANLVRKIEPLNIIGNVGPLIGLFGTVIGMIMTFIEIKRASGGAVNAQDLAKGISIALVCTAWGLTVAIPGLVVYGVFRNRLEMLSSEVASRGHELLAMFRASGGTRAAAPPAVVPAAPAAPRAPVAAARPAVQPNA